MLGGDKSFTRGLQTSGEHFVPRTHIAQNLADRLERSTPGGLPNSLIVNSKMTEKPKVPKAMQEKFDAIVRLTDAFCAERLDETYRRLIVEAVAALSRKRPSPLVRGKENIWAAAVVHAVGMVNFLFDSSQTPHCRAPEIYEYFGTAASTSQNKSKEVRELLGMSQTAFKWMRPSLVADNPLVWMVQLNGLFVDARSLPLELQQEAHARGLIPYVPEPR